MCEDGAKALAQYDRREFGGNNDGRIDANDRVFKKLRLWIDKNHDGISQPDELARLDSLGIQSFSLDAVHFLQHVPAGKITLSLTVNTKDGQRTAYDVWFHNKALPGFPLLAE